MAAEREQDGAENDDDADFDEGGPILQVGAFAGSPDVDGGDDGDHDDREDRFSQRGERNDFREVFGERAGERGDGTAGDDQEQAPAVEKSGDAAETIANEAVEATGFGVGGGKLGVSEGAEEG